jgi:UDP-N-acetylmuramate dehydrogenase
MPCLIIGGGSNLLFTKDFPGLVLRNEMKGIQLIAEDEDSYLVKAAAGENWHSFVSFCLSHHYYGIENLSLIPGTVGAAPIQNIGAYGVELKDVFHSLVALDLETGKEMTFSNDDCAFGYRDSIFKGRYKGQLVIISVSFRLKKIPNLAIDYGAIREELVNKQVVNITPESISQAIIQIRQSKLPDPLVLGNAGSFFKNPVITKEAFQSLLSKYPSLPGYQTGEDTYKIPAGWLIEVCGWKGYRKDDAGCYQKQALVLVNYGKASGKEIFDLSESIIQSVAQKFSIVLEREVNIL